MTDDDDLRLLDEWRHDRISEADFEVLQARLHDEPELRAELRALADLEEGLSGLATTPLPILAPMPTTARTRKKASGYPVWIPWTLAAAAGVVALMGWLPKGSRLPDGAIADSSDSSVIDWGEFTVSDAERTEFAMPGPNSAVLGRVTGASISQIDGMLVADGSVWRIDAKDVAKNTTHTNLGDGGSELDFAAISGGSFGYFGGELGDIAIESDADGGDFPSFNTSSSNSLTGERDFAMIGHGGHDLEGVDTQIRSGNITVESGTETHYSSPNSLSYFADPNQPPATILNGGSGNINIVAGWESKNAEATNDANGNSNESAKSGQSETEDWALTSERRERIAETPPAVRFDQIGNGGVTWRDEEAGKAARDNFDVDAIAITKSDITVGISDFDGEANPDVPAGATFENFEGEGQKPEGFARRMLMSDSTISESKPVPAAPPNGPDNKRVDPTYHNFAGGGLESEYPLGNRGSGITPTDLADGQIIVEAQNGTRLSAKNARGSAGRTASVDPADGFVEISGMSLAEEVSAPQRRGGLEKDEGIKESALAQVEVPDMRKDFEGDVTSTGGAIAIAGTDILLQSTGTIDASGSNGGGTINLDFVDEMVIAGAIVSNTEWDEKETPATPFAAATVHSKAPAGEPSGMSEPGSDVKFDAYAYIDLGTVIADEDVTGKEIDDLVRLDLGVESDAAENKAANPEHWAFDPAANPSALPRLNKARQFNTAEVRFAEIQATTEPFSTFSLNVSDVSFKLAQASLASGQWPESEKVRIEEFVNAFDYGDPMPSAEDRIACRHEQAVHPFLAGRNLLRISMRTAEAGRSSQTPLRLTLLLDFSGSMERADRRESVQRAFALLSQQLLANDQVTLIGFARQPRLLADRVSGTDAGRMLASVVARTPSDGGTNLEAALKLAMSKALEQKLEGAQNRIVLLTDGAANLGDADPKRLAGLVESMRLNGIAFDAAGVGAAGLNDELLEELTRKGDGRYYFLDRAEDADESFAQQIAGALRPAAMNVKVQVEFNSKRVGRYKLLGYEKHRLQTEDFRNDSVDAAELAAAEAGVALYQFEAMPNGEGDIGTVSVRFRNMATGQMVERRWPIPYEPTTPRIDRAAPSLRLATAASMLAAKLKRDPVGESAQLSGLAELVRGLPQSRRSDPRVQQLLEMIEQTRRLAGDEN
ncbi:MAG: filamentous hemagglutinin family protein [Verrucomicrobiales bacterium]|jgi:filamentous hemagglutinin family protein